MQTLKRTKCNHCGKEETVEVHITDNDEEITVVVKKCSECNHQSLLNELF